MREEVLHAQDLCSALLHERAALARQVAHGAPLAGIEIARWQDTQAQEVREKLAQAMAYPVLLLVARVLILTVLFLFVMPRFVSMNADLGAELPFPTWVLIGIVERLYIVGPAVVGAGVLAFIGRRRIGRSETARRRIDSVKERLPYVGDCSASFPPRNWRAPCRRWPVVRRWSRR